MSLTMHLGLRLSIIWNIDLETQAQGVMIVRLSLNFTVYGDVRLSLKITGLHVIEIECQRQSRS